jgi:hypothetical protein
MSRIKLGEIPDPATEYGEIRSSSFEEREVRDASSKKGTLKSGSGRKVKSRKQAIAIALNESRKKGGKVPRRQSKRSAKKR